MDTSDNLWVDNNSYGVSEISPSGVLLTATVSNWGYEPSNGSNNTFSSDYVRGFGGVAIAPTGNVLIGSAADTSSSLVVASSANGYALADYTGGSLYQPIAIAVDASGDSWVTSQVGEPGTAGYVVEYSPTGAVLSGASGIAVGSQPSSIAFDAAGDTWISNYWDSTLTVIPGAGSALAAGTYKGGGLHGPSALAIDGAGNVWASNFNVAYGISEFNGTTGAAMSPAFGFYIGATSPESGAVAVDSSGNVWAANWGPGNVSESIGIAAPTIDPVVVQAKNKSYGTKP